MCTEHVLCGANGDCMVKGECMCGKGACSCVCTEERMSVCGLPAKTVCRCVRRMYVCVGECCLCKENVVCVKGECMYV